jgi:F-type H+-transporting ATPase subunit delta
MQDTRIARRYAQALFTTALRHDVVRAVEDDLDGIVRLLDTDRSFRDFIMAPYTSRDEKIRIAERLFSDRVTALTMQVLRVMLEKRRESELPFVREEYIRLRRDEANILYAKVTSAEAIDADQRIALVAKLESTLGKTVEAEFEIDPTLIGGVKVAYENNVMDGTVKGALQKLRERLRYDLLKQA